MSKCVNCRKCKYLCEDYDDNTLSCQPKNVKIKTWQGKQWEIYLPHIKNANGNCPDFKSRWF